MTDRELLELAASAAGIEYEWHNGCGNALHLTAPDDTQIYWNPLADDRDALRLAVALKIDIHQRVAEPRVSAVAAMHSPKIEKCDDDSRLDATRRAIVRAAAAIGQAMKEKTT